MVEDIGELHLRAPSLNTEQIASDITTSAAHATEKYRKESGRSVQAYLDLRNHADAIANTINEEWQSASGETVGDAIRQGESSMTVNSRG